MTVLLRSMRSALPLVVRRGYFPLSQVPRCWPRVQLLPKPGWRANYLEVLPPEGSQLRGDGAAYRGCQNMTTTNQPCMPWDDVDMSFSGMSWFPGVESNFCRNPDGSSQTIWCFTSMSGVRKHCSPMARECNVVGIVQAFIPMCETNPSDSRCVGSWPHGLATKVAMDKMMRDIANTSFLGPNILPGRL